MASTNKTPYLQLDQFINTDVPSWLVDYNGDMLKIDNGVKAVNSKAESAVTTANALQGTVNEHTASIASLNTKTDNTNNVVSTLQTNLNNYAANGIMRNYTSSVSGNTIALVGAGEVVRFKAPTTWAVNMSFTINGTPYASRTADGKTLAAGYFVNGSIVVGVLDTSNNVIYIVSAAQIAVAPPDPFKITYQTYELSRPANLPANLNQYVGTAIYSPETKLVNVFIDAAGTSTSTVTVGSTIFDLSVINELAGLTGTSEIYSIAVYLARVSAGEYTNVKPLTRQGNKFNCTQQMNDTVRVSVNACLCTADWT